jgi:Zn-dependent protease
MTPEHLFVIVPYVAIVIMSIVLHEVAHGWVAYRCGDDTAYLMGRLTLNPLKHVDLFMTIVLPAMCIFMGFPAFGGAKPVPVNPYRLRRPVLDDRLVSAAGVAANLAIALGLSVVLRLALATKVLGPDSVGTTVLILATVSNLLLFVFNLVPIPPLDGSRILRTFLPWDVRQMFNQMDRWGLLLVFIAIQLPPLWAGLYFVIAVLWRYVLGLPFDLLRGF